MWLCVSIGSSLAAYGEDDSWSFDEGSEKELFEESFSLYGYLTNFFQSSFFFDAGGDEPFTYGDVLYLRLKGDWIPEDTLSFHLELAYYGRFGNQNPYSIYEDLGLAPQPQAEFPYNDFVHEIAIDHVWALANLGFFDLQFGKLPIAWGTGYLFNPTAKAAPMPFMDTVTEATPGTVGIIATFYLSERFALQGYTAFQERSHKSYVLTQDGRWENLPFGAKLQMFLGAFDVSVGFIREVFHDGADFSTANYASFDFDGAIEDFGLYGETAVRLPEAGSGPYDFEESLELVLGCYYPLPWIDVELRIEYFHQGSGETERSRYDVAEILAQKRLVLAEDYLFLFLERAFLDYLKIKTAALINLNDGSLVIYPTLAAEVYNNFEASLGAYIFLGGEGTEFNGELMLPDGSIDDLTEDISIWAQLKVSY
jgi:hypothetical protein